MPHRQFDLDAYFQKAKWEEVIENSPLLVSQRPPSVILEEQNLVYLSSIDLAYSLKDHEELRSAINDIEQTMQHAIENKNYYKAAVAESDIDAINNIINI